MICQRLTISEHHRNKLGHRAVLALLTAFFTTVASAADIDYAKQIKPIFAARCVACHGALKQEGSLRLDTGELIRKGGDSGKIVAQGDAASSELIKRITSTDPSDRMPQEGEPLHAEQINAIRQWIDQGANSPADEKADQDPREHWSFREIVRPPVPKPANAVWVRNPIDAFIAANHERHGLTPQAEAPRAELVRRLYLDLIGLPPSLEQIKEIEADREDGWYERLADRLLKSPQHGERWARHWMDVWRYSDWWGLGEQLRNSHQYIWHWRDWIVESLNANLPYDEMLRLMLDADELYPNDQNKLRATGFLVRQYFLFNRNTWLDETVEHVGKGFLGLTMNCTKCHDHKFDPIAQADYYRLRAFFEPYFVRMDSLPTEPDLARNGIPRVYDGMVEKPTYLFVRGDENNPDKSKSIAPGVPKILEFAELAIKPVPIPPEASKPDRRPWVLQGNLDAATKKLATAEADLLTANERLAEITAEAASKTPATDAKEKDKAPAGAPKPPDAVAIARADVDSAECAVAQAAAELANMKFRAEATKARWAVEDDTCNNSALAEAERAASNKAIAAHRRAELTKALSAVADTKRKLLTAKPDQKAAIEAEVTKAREARNSAMKTLDAPITKDDHFVPLVGTQVAPTRFASTIADDETVRWGDQSTGRRKALAEWMTDRRNPLVARVAVNHLWNRHFGAPLAPNVFDLGRNSRVPANRELLDWLAAEFIESGWDMRHLHQLIVTSATYRLSSDTTGRDENLVKDPDNIYWWRRSAIRLESEVIRDSILSLAGTLDLTMGGAPVVPEKQAESRRRSLYFFHSNNDRNLFLTTFDGALVTECYRRDQSVVPQQALAMTNSQLVLESSRPIAEKISQAISPQGTEIDDATFIRSTFLVLLGESPSDAELNASMSAIKEWRALPKATALDVRANFVWSLLNHNDFITLR